MADQPGEPEPLPQAPYALPGTTVEQITGYLAANFKVIDQTTETVTIAGEDFAGWSLDEFVIPRLASGLIFAEEIPASEGSTR